MKPPTLKLKALVLFPLAASALALTACSSDDAPADNPSINVLSCAPAAATSADPTWVAKGIQGQAAFTVTDEATNAAPKIDITTPFKVDKTEVKTLTEGTGGVVSDSSYVSVCYEGVNGTTGKVFDSAYQRGEPAQFSPAGVVPGFRDALVGQKVGSTVAVVIPPEDGYPTGTGDGSINAGDTIVFGLKILEIQE